MNNEIKVNKANKSIMFINNGIGFSQFGVADEILDLITNLQEKVDQYENPDDLTLFYMWLDEKAKDKMKQLQEENKEILTKWLKLNQLIDNKEDYITNLQEKNKELKKKITVNEKSRRKMQQSLIEQIETYKSRNEKAIEYLPEIRRTPSYELDEKIDNLENILQGEDKDVKD